MAGSQTAGDRAVADPFVPIRTSPCAPLKRALPFCWFWRSINRICAALLGPSHLIEADFGRGSELRMHSQHLPGGASAQLSIATKRMPVAAETFTRRVASCSSLCLDDESSEKVDMSLVVPYGTTPEFPECSPAAVALIAFQHSVTRIATPLSHGSQDASAEAMNRGDESAAPPAAGQHP